MRSLTIPSSPAVGREARAVVVTPSICRPLIVTWQRSLRTSSRTASRDDGAPSSGAEVVEDDIRTIAMITRGSVLCHVVHRRLSVTRRPRRALLLRCYGTTRETLAPSRLADSGEAFACGRRPLEPLPGCRHDLIETGLEQLDDERPTSTRHLLRIPAPVPPGASRALVHHRDTLTLGPVEITTSIAGPDLAPQARRRPRNEIPCRKVTPGMGSIASSRGDHAPFGPTRATATATSARAAPRSTTREPGRRNRSRSSSSSS